VLDNNIHLVLKLLDIAEQLLFLFLFVVIKQQVGNV
jgi:hypothetical protein